MNTEYVARELVATAKDLTALDEGLLDEIEEKRMSEAINNARSAVATLSKVARTHLPRHSASNKIVKEVKNAALSLERAWQTLSNELGVF